MAASCALSNELDKIMLIGLSSPNIFRRVPAAVISGVAQSGRGGSLMFQSSWDSYYLCREVELKMEQSSKEYEMKNRRSLVRVKIWLLEVVFVVCGLLLRFADLARGADDLVFAVASVTSVLFFFVRCEGCRTSEIMIMGPSSRLPFVTSWSGLFPSKHCSVCGKERY